MIKYQVWLTLEKWDGDNKICDEESTLIGEHKNENKAMRLWAIIEGAAMSIKENLQILFGKRF